jgi:2-dehydro-3-deoxyphosphogluconate aldolase / (4S)-4-hydroxy-2-oxoglutarate aldolase
MVTRDVLLDALRAQRLLAILRGGDRAAVVAAGMTLIDCGIGCLEVSLTSAGALDAITELAANGGGALVGAGTVLTADDARRAHSAGATFLVTPGLGPAIAAAGVPVIGGALTPTEIIAATESCAAVKLFPASLGGPAYLRAVRAPFPDVAFIPVGGVGLDEVQPYLSAGALAVGVGSPLVEDACDGGDLRALARRAEDFRTAAQASRR